MMYSLVEHDEYKNITKLETLQIYQKCINKTCIIYKMKGVKLSTSKFSVKENKPNTKNKREREEKLKPCNNSLAAASFGSPKP